MPTLKVWDEDTQSWIDLGTGGPPGPTGPAGPQGPAGELPTIPAGRCQLGANQNISSGTAGALQGFVSNYLNGGMTLHNLGAGLIVPVAGIYSIKVSVNWTANVLAMYWTSIGINGAQITDRVRSETAYLNPQQSLFSKTITCVDEMVLAEGDRVGVFAYQSTGNIQAAQGNASTAISVHLISKLDS
jgi:hypothetical protein